MNTTPDDVLSYWFGPTDSPDYPQANNALWWGKDPKVDAEIKERFQEALEAAGRGELQGWKETPRGRLALILLIDQLSRNMFRDTARMYALDHEAQDLSLEGLMAGEHEELAPFERSFLFMPLMHAENVALQRLCVRLFGADPVLRETNLDYAEKHAVIVERFGRFPHRNEILGRESTEEELAFLKEPNSSF